MTDLSERPHVEDVVMEDGCWDDDPFAPTKLIGVAVAGALGSLALYYLYAQLEPERRQKLKDSMVAAVRAQMRRWGEDTEEI